ANGFGRKRVDLVFGHDAELALGENVWKPGIRDGEGEAYAQRIERLDLVHHRQVGARARARIGIENALDGGDDVLGIQRAAVMELHALAQLEGPSLQILRRLPTRREIRLNRQIAVDTGQTVEDKMNIDVLVAEGRLGEIELIEGGADGDADRTLRCCRRCETSQQGCRDNDTPHVAYLRNTHCHQL